jgi:hypothetical protein
MDRAVNELGDDDPDATISRGPLRHAQVDSLLWPVLAAHGLIPTAREPARMDRLSPGLTAHDLYLGGTVALGGAQATIALSEPADAKPPMIDEYWVALDREAFVLRHVCRAGRRPFIQVDAEPARSEHGWMPVGWAHTVYSGDEVQEVTKLKVTRLEVNPQVEDTDFDLPVPPRALLWVQENPESGEGLDPSRPALTRYRVGPTGRWEKLNEVGFTTLDGVEQPPRSSWPTWSYLLIGSAVLAIVAVLVWYRRHKSVR